MNAYRLDAAKIHSGSGAERDGSGSLASSIEELCGAVEVLAGLFDCREPLETDYAGQVTEILSLIPGSPLQGLTADPETFRKEWDALSTQICGLPDTLRLEESVYKAWTTDDAHPLAGRKGLAWGDPALHMLAMLGRYGLALEPLSDKAPDNLTVLLDFMAFLMRNRPHGDVLAFCKDHLDWLPELRKEAEARQVGSMFLAVVETAECLIGHVASLQADGDF